jgi:chromosome partitioning protein
MKVITVSLPKGGNGKTTTVVNLGAALGMEGARVLIMDLDSTGYATRWLGVDVANVDPDHSAYGVITGRTSLADASFETDEQNVFLCPADPGLVNVGGELGQKIGGLFTLRKMLAASKTLPVDVILIDCPGEQNPVVFNAVVAADRVLVPILAESPSLDALVELDAMVTEIRDTYNLSVPNANILLSRYEEKGRSNEVIKDHLMTRYGDRMFNTIIRQSVPIHDSYHFHQSVFRYRPAARAAGWFRDLAAEVKALLA